MCTHIIESCVHSRAYDDSNSHVECVSSVINSLLFHARLRARKKRLLP